ncbi:MAG: GTP-binding protein, partial [Bradymonadaceae bacterium]
VERADIAVLMFDAVEGITNQDKKIAGVIGRRGCACVVAANKWDLVDTYPGIGDEFARYIDRELYFLDWAPARFVSALSG